MQESCVERKAASPPLDGPLQPPSPPSPPLWTPEHFLQSTLHEGKGVVRLSPGNCVKAEGAEQGEPAGPAKPARGRRKQQWKLKFHHQALPPEYLDHYEASLSKARPGPMAAPPPHTASAPAPAPFCSSLPSESIQHWLQRITSIQSDLERVPSSSPAVPHAAPAPSRRRRTVPLQSEINTIPIAPKVVNYRDLPYMGEMTLNNSKPRRGRKPKKADICHLIYKNYGTIFPGTPGHLVDERLNGTAVAGDYDKNNIQIKKEKGDKSGIVAPNKQKTDLQNKIISSLLEKRLSQENKKHKEVKVRKQRSVPVEQEDDIPHQPLRLQTSPPSTPSTLASPSISEPLNLCVRDLNNLKIRLLRKHGNVYAKATVEPKIEPNDVESCEEDKSLPDHLPSTSAPESVSPAPRMNIPDFKKALQEATSSGESDASTIVGKADVGAESPLPVGYVFWPNAGVFVHPLALQSQLLYYQGLAAGSSYTLPPDTGSPESPLSAKLGRSTPTSLEPSPEQRSSPGGSSGCSTPCLKRVPSASRGPMAAPAKRKRSAIFIPPMPSDSGSSPATEVSICKFKFTGGARPSLQEKKMLSVDSGGNFRYYSGTGDKANRGYEFFPRESLQQSVGAGAGGGAASGPLPLARPEDLKRKRKSRKSLQREKLEQTFKEKGFLIQTQQLESAEGATYCKFRQLRKFTRYLFRSWKDYLPGAIQDSESAPGIVQPLLPPPPGDSEWP